jgi:hypothetical protein
MHTHNSIDSTNLQVLVKQDSATITWEFEYFVTETHKKQDLNVLQ